MGEGLGVLMLVLLMVGDRRLVHVFWHLQRRGGGGVAVVVMVVWCGDDGAGEGLAVGVSCWLRALAPASREGVRGSVVVVVLVEE